MNFTEKISVLLAFIANFIDTFDNCSICEVGAVWAPPYLLSNGTKKVYEAYTDSKRRFDAHAFHESRSEVIKALHRRFRSNNVLQDAHD